MSIIQVSSREFRDNQASFFAMVDKGEQVVIRRKGKAAYMIVPVSDDDFVVSPELEAKIEEGRRQYREGNVTTCATKEELDKFLESL